jgi:hypothetical protein
MPETNNIIFTYKELAEALIRQNQIHEGLWGIFVKFGLNAANVASSGGELTPSAIVGLLQIGIQRFEKPNNLTVDANEVNPPVKKRAKKKGAGPDRPL